MTTTGKPSNDLTKLRSPLFSSSSRQLVDVVVVVILFVDHIIASVSIWGCRDRSMTGNRSASATENANPRRCSFVRPFHSWRNLKCVDLKDFNLIQQQEYRPSALLAVGSHLIQRQFCPFHSWRNLKCVDLKDFNLIQRQNRPFHP